MKILFAGNSITRHGPKTEIGWDGDYGMAASCPENDYVHVVCRMLEARGKHIIYKAANISEYELSPCPESVENIKKLSEFGADIVIIRIGENVAEKDADRFGEYFPSLIGCFENSTVFVVSSFWKKPQVEAKTEAAAKECGVNFISLKGIQGDEYKALGEYAHEGVAAHPSDKGMRAIAELIFDSIEKAGLITAPVIPDFNDGWSEKTDYRVTVIKTSFSETATSSAQTRVL